MDQDQLSRLLGIRLKESNLPVQVGPWIIVGDDELPVFRPLFMGKGIAPFKGQNIKILVELPDERTVIIGEHHISPAGTGLLPQPDVKLAMKPHITSIGAVAWCEVI